MQTRKTMFLQSHTLNQVNEHPQMFTKDLKSANKVARHAFSKIDMTTSIS